MAIFSMIKYVGFDTIWGNSIINPITDWDRMLNHMKNLY